MKLSAVRLIIAALAFAIVGYVVHSIGAIATMQYYFDPSYFPVWSKLMMPSPGPPPFEFAAYSFVVGFVGALLFSLVYWKVKGFFKGTSTKSGLKFGFGAYLVGILPGYMSLALLINLPIILIIAWAIESIITYLIGGMIVAKILK